MLVQAQAWALARAWVRAPAHVAGWTRSTVLGHVGGGSKASPHRRLHTRRPVRHRASTMESTKRSYPYSAECASSRRVPAISSKTRGRSQRANFFSPTRNRRNASSESGSLAHVAWRRWRTRCRAASASLARRFAQRAQTHEQHVVSKLAFARPAVFDAPDGAPLAGISHSRRRATLDGLTEVGRPPPRSAAPALPASFPSDLEEALRRQQLNNLLYLDGRRVSRRRSTCQSQAELHTLLGVLPGNVSHHPLAACRAARGPWRSAGLWRLVTSASGRCRS